MYRGGYLIQVGRGEHLVEADLLAALETASLPARARRVRDRTIAAAASVLAPSPHRRHAA
jgi:phosphoglycerate dehydrogenase-like enzyme